MPGCPPEKSAFYTGQNGEFLHSINFDGCILPMKVGRIINQFN